MSTALNRNVAKEIIMDAYNIASQENYTPSSNFTDEIHTILEANHLTFKYIMVTSLLSKASYPQINPLCLQKGSKLKGAYDARSICHFVLVPFEREYLFNALGGSNEPFLNKPARFPELNPSNPVRKGKDQELLNLLCDFLPKVNSTEQAFKALTDSLYYALQKVKDKNEIIDSLTVNNSSFLDVENFVHQLLTKSFGGESLTVAIGVLINIFTDSLKGETRVNVHVVNQSGASSNEISDIDIYMNKEILFGIEAKDKIYAEQDVMHAVEKASVSNCSRLMFVTGPQGKLVDSEITHIDLIEKAANKGVYLTFLDYRSFTKIFLSISFEKSLNDFFRILLMVSDEARVKSETKKHFIEVAKEIGIVE